MVASPFVFDKAELTAQFAAGGTAAFFLLHKEKAISVDSFLRDMRIALDWPDGLSQVLLCSMLSQKVVNVVDGVVTLQGRGVELGRLAYETYRKCEGGH